MLDPKALKSNARRLLLQYHPDRLARSTPQERRLAEQFSAHLNRGREVLEDPLLRAAHLLELVDVEANFDNRTIRDASFLMQQMELREALEDAANTEDCKRLSVQVEEKLEALFHSFETTDFESERLDNANADRLLSNLAKIHFYIKFSSDIKAALRGFS